MKTTTLKKIILSTLFLLMVGCGGGGSAESKNTPSNAAGADTQAPTVLSVSPIDQETDVELDTNISVLFDKNMLASSLTKSSITLKKANNTLVDGNVSFNATNIAIFSPNKKLALLSEYVLTVNSTVSDLAGNTLGNEEQHNFTTRDGKWQEAKLLEINNAGDAEEPQIAFDTSGNAIAVWRQFDGTRYIILARKFTPNSGWGVEEQIDNKNRGASSKPQIAFDTLGNAIAVWIQRNSNGNNPNIFINRFTPTGGWSGAEQIEGNDIGGSGNPQIAFNTLGNATVIWESSLSGRRILVREFTPNGGSSAEEQIDSNSNIFNNFNSTNPQIAFDTVGNGIAIWEREDANRTNIWVSRFTPSRGWHNEEKIENDDTGSAYQPQIAFDILGNAFAIWRQSDGIRSNILVNRFTPSRGWHGAETIEENSGTAVSPQVSIDSKGNAIAVWHQLDGARESIWANRFTPTDDWGNAEEIEDDSEEVNSPQISMDSAGNAIAVWKQDDGTRANIRANRFTPRNGWGSAEEIEDDTGGTREPQVSMDRAGNAIAVWSQSDGTRANIMVNHFE